MIDQLSSHLRLDSQGIYQASNKSAISYPEDQNALCMQFEEDSFWFQHRNNAIVEMVRQFPAEGPILDIGGGNGFVALGLEKNGFETILLEPGEMGALNAKKRGLTHVICATIQDAELIPESVSAAGMFDVIEHIEDDVNILRHVHRSLKKGGRMYFSVPAFQFLWSQVDADAGHYRRYTRTSMSRALLLAGFQVEFSTYIFSVLPIPIFLFRSIPTLLGSKKKHAEIAATKKNEHTRKISFLDKIWEWELEIVRSRRPIIFGGTLLVSAVKQ